MDEKKQSSAYDGSKDAEISKELRKTGRPTYVKPRIVEEETFSTYAMKCKPTGPCPQGPTRHTT